MNTDNYKTKRKESDKKNKDENFCDFIPPPPPDATALMLINHISKTFDNIIRKDEFEFSSGARMIMMVLSRRQPCSQLDIVNETHLKPPTVSVTLQKMEMMGFVERQPDNKDLRLLKVYLTEKGNKFNEEIFNKIKNIDSEALNGFSEEETKQCISYLKRIYDNCFACEKGKKDL